MSRNLCTSSCPHCGYTVRLSDIRGKALEFRRYGPYTPVLGCRWDCSCGVAYFVIWRNHDRVWGRGLIDQADKEYLTLTEQHRVKNTNRGRFYVDRPAVGNLLPACRTETGAFTLDLSYYETYNDEDLEDKDEVAAIRSGEKKPWHLCEDDAEDVQLLW